MAAPEHFAQRQIPLAPRAPFIHDVDGVVVQREGRRMQDSRALAFRLLPVGHGIHFDRFKFGKIEPEMLCNERA